MSHIHCSGLHSSRKALERRGFRKGLRGGSRTRFVRLLTPILIQMKRGKILHRQARIFLWNQGEPHCGSLPQRRDSLLFHPPRPLSCQSRIAVGRANMTWFMSVPMRWCHKSQFANGQCEPTTQRFFTSPLCCCVVFIVSVVFRTPPPADPGQACPNHKLHKLPLCVPCAECFVFPKVSHSPGVVLTPVFPAFLLVFAGWIITRWSRDAVHAVPRDTAPNSAITTQRVVVFITILPEFPHNTDHHILLTSGQAAASASPVFCCR